MKQKTNKQITEEVQEDLELSNPWLLVNGETRENALSLIKQAISKALSIKEQEFQKEGSWEKMCINYREEIEDLKQEISNRRANENKLKKLIEQGKQIAKQEVLLGIVRDVKEALKSKITNHSQQSKPELGKENFPKQGIKDKQESHAQEC